MSTENENAQNAEKQPPTANSNSSIISLLILITTIITLVAQCRSYQIKSEMVEELRRQQQDQGQ